MPHQLPSGFDRKHLNKHHRSIVNKLPGSRCLSQRHGARYQRHRQRGMRLFVDYNETTEALVSLNRTMAASIMRSAQFKSMHVASTSE